ncbi:MAG: ATP-dependent helicase HrpB, partial [Myxococcales bacterium]|nr:ATP-dependent helicase HrpB [Myxococcales bacterium]
MRTPLPIDDVLPEVVAHLRKASSLVLLAPPGAGKTTRLPQALVDEGVVAKDERVLVLEPRRLAARLAATRIAAERKSRLGGEVGYQVRFDDKTSAETRIALVTEGILTRRLQSDPFLEGVGAVVLDEFHERSIHADLGLAFLREIQLTVRPELKIVVMSATLDPAPVRRFLGECPVVESQGRIYPVELRFLERPDERWPVDLAVSGARRAVREVPEGDVLVFLPGAGEIHRAQDELQNHLEGVDVCPLYGELDPGAQDRAVAPGPRRKVILSTNIAESSLTIEGVRVVVDVGFHKLNRFEPGLGLDRLVEQRISARSAAQRTGRAGRLGPGVAYRMWTEKEDRALPQEDLPEIARVDLAPVLLDVLRWSASDPAAFGWFESPPPAALARGLGLLRALGALPREGFQLTPVGEKMAQLPLHPRLAALLMHAHAAGRLREGARLAALASERDILDRAARATDEVGSSDLELRLERLDGFEADGAGRHSGQAFGVNVGAAKNVLAVARRLEQLGRQVLGKERASGGPGPEHGEWVLAAYPDRVAKRRRPGEDGVVFVGGGGGRLAPESVVKTAPYLVAVEVDAGRGRRADGALVRQASAVERRWLEATGLVKKVHAARWNAEKFRAEAVVEVRYLDDLVLEERPDPEPDPDALAAALAKAAAEDIERAVPLTDALGDFFNRYRFLAAQMPELELPPLGPDDRQALLPDLVVGKKSFAELAKEDVVSWFSSRLTRVQQAALTSQAPVSVPIPSGRQARLRYEVEGPPVLSVRLQEVFGLYDSPRVAGGRVPVKMELLAP